LTISLLRFKPKYSPPGFTPGSALLLLLIPAKCSQRYPLDFALGLIPAINLAIWGWLDLCAPTRMHESGARDQALAF